MACAYLSEPPGGRGKAVATRLEVWGAGEKMGGAEGTGWQDGGTLSPAADPGDCVCWSCSVRRSSHRQRTKVLAGGGVQAKMGR